MQEGDTEGAAATLVGWEEKGLFGKSLTKVHIRGGKGRAVQAPTAPACAEPGLAPGNGSDAHHDRAETQFKPSEN